MSLTSYRAAPPRDKLGNLELKREGFEEIRPIRLEDLAATYSPAS